MSDIREQKQKLESDISKLIQGFFNSHCAEHYDTLEVDVNNTFYHSPLSKETKLISTEVGIKLLIK